MTLDDLERQNRGNYWLFRVIWAATHNSRKIVPKSL